MKSSSVTINMKAVTVLSCAAIHYVGEGGSNSVCNLKLTTLK